jgi:hypothetical protein
MTGPDLTRIIMLATVALLTTYDIFAVAWWGREAAISSQLLTIAHRFPVVPFLLGMLAGHTLWGQKH